MALYFAYGSNLWRGQMRERCPGHLLVGSGLLRGYRWIISGRGYANVVESSTDMVMGTIYDLSPEDEQRLDRFEGVERGDYHKEMHLVEGAGGVHLCLVYVDPVEEEGVPWPEYVGRLRRGIADARLPAGYVERYLRRFLPEVTERDANISSDREAVVTLPRYHDPPEGEQIPRIERGAGS